MSRELNQINIGPFTIILGAAKEEDLHHLLEEVRIAEERIKIEIMNRAEEKIQTQEKIDEIINRKKLETWKRNRRIQKENIIKSRYGRE